MVSIADQTIKKLYELALKADKDQAENIYADYFQGLLMVEFEREMEDRNIYNVIKLIEHKGLDVNQRTSAKKLTPLMVAVQVRDLKAVEQLLKKGADVNAQNYRGTAVLSFLSFYPERPSMSDILRMQGDPDFPLDIEEKILLVLLKYQPKLDLTNVNGKTIIQLFQQKMKGDKIAMVDTLMNYAENQALNELIKQHVVLENGLRF